MSKTDSKSLDLEYRAAKWTELRKALEFYETGVDENGIRLFDEELKPRLIRTVERIVFTAWDDGTTSDRVHQDQHWSDCARHNGPAEPEGECDCPGRYGISPTMFHELALANRYQQEQRPSSGRLLTEAHILDLQQSYEDDLEANTSFDVTRRLDMTAAYGAGLRAALPYLAAPQPAGQEPSFQSAELLANDPEVHYALRAFSHDSTGDNGTEVVLSILKRIRPSSSDRQEEKKEGLDMKELADHLFRVAEVLPYARARGKSRWNDGVLELIKSNHDILDNVERHERPAPPSSDKVMEEKALNVGGMHLPWFVSVARDGQRIKSASIINSDEDGGAYGLVHEMPKGMQPNGKKLWLKWAEFTVAAVNAHSRGRKQHVLAPRPSPTNAEQER